MIRENLSTLEIHKLTQEQYNRELEAGRLNENAIYLTPGEEIDLGNYLPLDGSKATTSARLPLFNDFCVVYADGQQINLQTRNEAGSDENRRILRVYNSTLDQYKDISKALRFVDVTDGTSTAYLIYGEHNKPSAADVGALPLSGGNITGNAFGLYNGYGNVYANQYQAKLEAKNTPNDALTEVRTLSIRNSNYPNSPNVGDALWLYDTISTDGQASTSAKGYLIYGEHNKPSGSYTGNDSTTERGIVIGNSCKGYALLISSDNGFVIVTNSGALSVPVTGTITHIPSSEVQYVGGAFFIRSSNFMLNASGTTYYYQLL